MSSNVPQYPVDHPIWRDINFTPNWVWERAQESLASDDSLLRIPRAMEKQALPADANISPSSRSLNNKEDLLLIYLFSETATQDRVQHFDVGLAVGRTPQYLKNKWKVVAQRFGQLSPEEQKLMVDKGRRLAVDLSIPRGRAPETVEHAGKMLSTAQEATESDGVSVDVEEGSTQL